MAEQLAAAQALLLSERGRSLLVINPGACRGLLFCVFRRFTLRPRLCTGSVNLRLGWASEEAPVEVKHVVAYARRGEVTAQPRQPDAALLDEEQEAACRQVCARLRTAHGVKA